MAVKRPILYKQEEACVKDVQSIRSIISQGGTGSNGRLQNMRQSYWNYQISGWRGAAGEGRRNGIVDRLLEIGTNYKIEINVSKSKVMRIWGRQEPLWITVRNKERWAIKFGKTLCTKDIGSRIAIARSAFTKKRSLLTSNSSLS